LAGISGTLQHWCGQFATFRSWELRPARITAPSRVGATYVSIDIPPGLRVGSNEEGEIPQKRLPFLELAEPSSRSSGRIFSLINVAHQA